MIFSPCGFIYPVSLNSPVNPEEPKKESKPKKDYRKRARKTLLALVAAATLGLALAPTCHRVVNTNDTTIRASNNQYCADAPKKKKYTILTYNVAHFRGGMVEKDSKPSDWCKFWLPDVFCYEYSMNATTKKDEMFERFKDIADLIKEYDPDFVVLNEIDWNTSTSFGVNQVKELSELLKMCDSFGSEWNFWFPFAYREHSGNAVLSKYPIKGVNVPFDRPWHHSATIGGQSYMEVHVDIGYPLVILHSHLDPSSRWNRNSQARDMRARAEELMEQGKYVTITGDLNDDVPEEYRKDDIDGLLVEDVMKGRVLEDDGKDYVLETMIQDGMFKFYWNGSPSPQTSAESEVTIDYILPDRNQIIERCEVPIEKFRNKSDHYPVVCTIEIDENGKAKK